MSLNYKYIYALQQTVEQLLSMMLCFHLIYLFNYLSVTRELQLKAVCNRDELILLQCYK